MSFFPKKPMAPPQIIPGDGNSLPSFSYESFSNLRLVGAGAYGDVYCGDYRGDKVCIKLLKNSDTTSVLREARFLHRLNHKNIVNFHAVDSKKKAIMMEFLQFDFTPYGLNKTVSNVSEFLQEIDPDPVNGKNFEHVVPFIADQLLYAMVYLHSNNVAHRDLKPSNILLSNLKYNQSAENWLRCEEWCEVKLSDYGESWGNIVETSSAVKTHTISVFKGTPAYMAPEVHGKKAKLSEDELKRADIWSLGMVMFSLMNPDSRAPYFEEAFEEGCMAEFSDYVCAKTNAGVKPQSSEKYDSHRKSVWSPISEIYNACLVEPSDRPDLLSLQSLMGSGIKLKLNLSCHQGTVFEQAQRIHAEGGVFTPPSNDGTSGCSFLALKIGEVINSEIFMAMSMVLNWPDLKKQCEQIITNFPEEFNTYRDKDKDYCPDDACKVLLENGLLKACNRTFSSYGCFVFSPKGIEDIKASLDTDGMHVFTMEPYTFLYGKSGDEYFIIDTHAVPAALGGNSNGLIVVFAEKRSCVTWLLQRCYYIYPKPNTYQQVISLIFVNPIFSDPFDYDSINEVEKPLNDSPHGLINHNKQVMDKPMVDLTQEDRPSTEENYATVDLTEDNDEDNVVNSLLLPSPQKSGYIDLTQDTDCGQMKYFGKYRLPYIKSYKRKLSETESYQLIQSDGERCQRVPQGCKENAIFLIDSNSLSSPEDVKSDMMVFKEKCYESKLVKLEKMPNGGLLRRRKATGGETVDMQVNRKGNHVGLIRNIVYFIDGEDRRILNDTILVQYYLDYKIVPHNQDKVEFDAKPHGNAKYDRKFYPVKKSIREDMKRKVASGDRVRNIYEDYNKEMNDDGDFGDSPRNKKQLFNIKGQTLPTNETAVILGYNTEYRGGEFVWTHADFPTDIWVLGTQTIKNELRNSAKSYPMSIDPTFNFGTFEVTPITYKSHLFQTKCKNTMEWRDTLLPGPVILHHSKDENTYDSALRCCSKELDMEKEKFGILTDGEPALITAVKNNFKKAIHGRCTNHFHRNCKEFITKNLGDIPFNEMKLILDTVFGEEGLVEANDKADLKKKMTNACDICDKVEIAVLNKGPQYKPRFSAYLRENEKVIKRMVRDVRLSMGLPVKSDGVPMRIYTNQSECMNSVMKAKKTALGYANRTDLMKYQFIKEIYLAIVEEKEQELKRAVYGQSDQHRLSPNAKYLQLDTGYWFELSEVQQDQYLKKIRSLSVADLDSKKNVKVTPLHEEAQPVDNRNSLSISLVVELPGLFYAKSLEQKALKLLNSPNGIKSSPTMGDGANNNAHKIFLVASGKKEKDLFYKVKVTNKKKVSCPCKAWDNVHICSHSVAVAEKENCLRDLIDNAKQGKRFPNTQQGNEGGGRKGKVRRRKRQYESQSPAGNSSQSTPVFTEIWHNNNLLELCFVSDIPVDKDCTQCGKQFPRGTLAKAPWDIAIKHKEKWLYPNKESSNPPFLVSKFLTTKFYCPDVGCITKRFPYFIKDLLQVPEDMVPLLQKEHLELLKDGFGFDA